MKTDSLFIVRRAAIAGLIVSLAILTGCDQFRNSEKQFTGEVETISVTVEIRSNGLADDETFTCDVPGSTTAFGVLEFLKSTEKLNVQSSGSGETAFVAAINGIQNAGSGGDNWLYRVNGELGKTGSGLHELVANDVVTWSFGKYDLSELESGDEE